MINIIKKGQLIKSIIIVIIWQDNGEGEQSTKQRDEVAISLFYKSPHSFREIHTVHFYSLSSRNLQCRAPTTNIAFFCKNLPYFVLKSWQRYPRNSSPSIDKIDILAHWVVIVVSPRATLSRWCGLRWLEEMEEVDDRFGEIRKAKRGRGGVHSTCWRIGEGGTFL